MFEHHALITDDEPEMARMLAEIAADAGFIPHVALDMQDIVAICDKINPEVIMLDIMMRDVDGFEVLHYLERTKSTAHILIISGQDSYRPMAERLGEAQGLTVDASFSKPFRINALRMALQEIRFNLPERIAKKAS